VTQRSRTALPHWPAPVVLAAPSGTGKTTISHKLVNEGSGYGFSVSATTRAPRPNEQDGVDYHFVTRDVFEEWIRAGRLCEWAPVHGEMYGTPVANLEEAQARGEHMVLDIDVQGARQIREHVPGALLIFIIPPSIDAMMSRLAGRGTEKSAQVARRLRTAVAELAAAKEFDYVLVNEDLEATVQQIRDIVQAEGHRVSRAIGFDGLIAEMCGSIDRVLAEEFQGQA
jgi:guanylate kinase